MASPKAKPLPSRCVPASVMRMMAPRVVKPKAKAGEEVASAASPDASAVSAATVAAAAAAVSAAAVVNSDFSVTVPVSAHKPLGIDVDWTDGKTLLVKTIMAGAVKEWNARNADRAIRSGYRIVAINGLWGNAEAMVRECRVKRELHLVVRPDARGAVPALPPAKRARTTGTDSLYAGMPAPDPEKDKSADSRAKELDIFAEAAAAENPRLAVFLDIDGVLRKLENEGMSISIDGENIPLNMGNRTFAPEAVRALKYVVHKTGAVVVLSSEWRRSPALREEAATALRAVGLPPLVRATVVLDAREELLVGSALNVEKEATLRLRWIERRSREISAWLREHAEVERWVALDDIDLARADEVRLPDTQWMAPGLVRTTASEGLTMSNARKAVEKLLGSTEGKV